MACFFLHPKHLLMWNINFGNEKICSLKKVQTYGSCFKIKLNYYQHIGKLFELNSHTQQVHLSYNTHTININFASFCDRINHVPKAWFLCASHSIASCHTCLKISPYGVHSPNLHKFSLVDVMMTTKHEFIVCEFTKYKS